MIVAVLAGTPAEVRADLAALAVRRASLPAEVVAEVRLDLMDPPDPLVIRNAPLPLIATCRRPRDGGRFRGPESDRLDLLRRAAQAGARWVDVEADALDAWPSVPGCGLVASLHDFDATPPDLPALVRHLVSAAIPMVKLATRARSLLDLMTLAAAVREAPGRVVALGLGGAGAAARILADRLGSAWTYARFCCRPGDPPRELADVGVPELSDLVDFYRGGRFDRESPAFAVVGDRADESMGPAVFNRVLREVRLPGTYVSLKSPSLAGLREVCRLLNVRGLSVTTPFKEAVLAAADRIEEPARAVGAANTLAFSGGEWVASNTDITAVATVVGARLNAQRRAGSGMKALVAGAGGMGRAAARALLDLGCRVSMTSRSAERLRNAASALGVESVTAAEASGRLWDVLVNATPAGSSRDPDGRALLAAWAAPGAIVVESNYRPLVTPLVREARDLGLDAVTGDAVYAAQAAAQIGILVPGVPGASSRIEAAVSWALNASS